MFCMLFDETSKNEPTYYWDFGVGSQMSNQPSIDKPWTHCPIVCISIEIQERIQKVFSGLHGANCRLTYGYDLIMDGIISISYDNGIVCFCTDSHLAIGMGLSKEKMKKFPRFKTFNKQNFIFLFNANSNLTFEKAIEINKIKSLYKQIF